MAARYVKSVRTRYRSTLEKEIQCANEIFTQISANENENIEIDKDDWIEKIDRCMDRIQSYCEKLENQSEKLASVTSENDPEICDEIIEADVILCDHALDCYSELKRAKVKLLKSEEIRQKSEGSADTTYNEQVFVMQQQMQTFMIEQSKQQREFLKRQEHKEDKASSLKLPKLDLVTFSGNKLKWKEFWDSFECTVHNNSKLSNIEKFSYLQSKLVGEAKGAIAGLALSNENYHVAVRLLKERYGNTQEVIDLHYRKLIELAAPRNKTDEMRRFLDTIERHLRSLEVLNQDINQDVFISMIRSKIPKDVLLQMELRKEPLSKWTVGTLRECLQIYIVACERTEQSSNQEVRKPPTSHDASNKFRPNTEKRYEKPAWKFSRTTPSAEALVATTKSNTPSNSKIYYDKCRYCEKQHWSDECQQFKTVEERKSRLKDSCYKCLNVNHKSRDCKRNKMCVHCGANNEHHRSLCPKKFGKKANKESVQLSEEISETERDSGRDEEVLISSGEFVLMQTAMAEVTNPLEDCTQEVRLLLDCGSQRTYITEQLADKLKLDREDETELKLVTFGSTKPKVIRTPSTKLNIKLKDGNILRVTANIVPHITGTVQRKVVPFTSSDNMNYLMKSLDLADTTPTECETTTVEFLLGNDYYLDVVLPQRIELQPGLYLLSSKLGWILTGRTKDNDDTRNNDINMLVQTYGTSITETNTLISADNAVLSKPNLEDFWNVESIGVTDKPDEDEEGVIREKFRDTLKFENNRYQVTWPWKSEIPDLAQNRELAIGRLRSCLSKLKNKGELMAKYDEVIHDQLNKGVIEKVESHSADGIKHYLPHHAVINPTKATTKLRVVYDASAKSKREHSSLNDCLYRGPVMLHDLCGILLRFRLHRIAMVADIEKAFLQVGLQPDQRDVTRFFWINDCDKPVISDDNIQEYRFCRVPFGVISSPFLLGATIDYHLSCYDTYISEQLKNDIYVDNVITGTSTVDEAKQLYMQSKTMFSDASMNLREWMSNNRDVINSIPCGDRAETETAKILGYTWNIESDCLSVNPSTTMKMDIKESTKRIVLKQLASVFDPLGLFSPVLLRGKLLIQTMWIKHLDWDDPLDTETANIWSALKPDLRNVSDSNVPRNIAIDGECDVNYSLVCFCDASMSSYATAIYLLQTFNTQSRSDLVFSKTRVAPLKGMTIPRLELMAVLIGVRCVDFVKHQLKLPIERIYLWSDSQCVLTWISTDKTLSKFVQNRVDEIVSHNDITFAHVPSKENPADIASRGSMLQDLVVSNTWWHGPKWLQQPETAWPRRQEKSVPMTAFESELKKKKQTGDSEVLYADVKDTDQDSMPLGINCDEFSSVTRLIRVTALVLRFIRKIRKKLTHSGPLTGEELNDAERLWILHVQKFNFPSEFSSILKEKPSNLTRQLGLFVDNSGILRCRGRLENAELSEGSRFPVLLPRNERFTRLVIEKVHKRNLHSGVSQTLSQVRSRFWIPQGRATVRSTLRTCAVCRRYEGGSYKRPTMPPLPKSRVSEAVPFLRTGLDYFGPLYIKTTEGAKKVWVCLFTCMCTRAVNLELVNDMTTSEFLMALKRFIAQRGKPAEILSDNASQFKAADKLLGAVWGRVFTHEDVQGYVSNERIRWSFIVEMAPWMGGFYERLVGVVKCALRKSIGRNRLTLVQLQTLLKEVEAVVNSRPLIYVGDDINSTLTLTPSHFLTLNPNTGVPESEFEGPDAEYHPQECSGERLLNIWNKGQKLLNKFWKVWREEYLLSLRERTQTELKSKRIQSPSEPQIGDVVLVKDNVSRGCWNLGKIVQLNSSRDGQIRSARVQLSTAKVINRPLNLLFPIEVSIKVPPDEVAPNTELIPLKSIQRPKRSAAAKAEKEINRRLCERMK